MSTRTSNGRRGFFGVVAFVVILVMLAVVAWQNQGKYGIPYIGGGTEKIQNKVIGKDDTGAQITASSNAAPKDLKARAIELPKNLQPNGLESIKDPKQPWHFTEVTPRGGLKASLAITLPLDRAVKKGETILIAVNHTHTADGWRVIPVPEAQIGADRKHATFVVNELSWFTPLWENVAGLGNEIKTAFLDGFSGGLLEQAQAPSCPGQNTAEQDDYKFSIEAKNTITGCLDIVVEDGVDRDEQLRLIKIVNMVKYPLEIKHSNVTIKTRGKAGLDLAKLADFGDHLVLEPGDEATFTTRLKHDTKATIDTDASKLALGLHAVDILVKAILTVLTKIDVQGIAKKAEVLETILGSKDCANVLFDLNIGSILANCFNDEMLKTLFNWKAAILGPVMLFISSINLGYAMAQAWDDNNNGRTKQNVTVARPEPNPLASLILPNGAPWHVHGYDLWLKNDSAYSTSNAGPCDREAPLTETVPMCREHVKYSVKAIGNGVAKVTITEKWFALDDGTRYNEYDDVSGRGVGDGFTLKLNAEDPHLADWVWDDAANNSSEAILCDPYAAQRNDTEEYQKCGA